MAATDKTTKDQPMPDNVGPHASEGDAVQTAASPPIDRDPAELDKTLKKDIIKVSDKAPISDSDPFYGQGGAYVVNEQGVRVKAD